MKARARRALRTIRQCVAAKRYRVLPHFTQRMDERASFWPDVRAVIEGPDAVRDGGQDEFDRPKWIIAGETSDELPIELVCVLDRDEQGRLVVFITLYERE